MEFDLEKVIEALLFSTSEPLSAKDIRGVIARYHENREEVSDEEGEEAKSDVPDKVGVEDIEGAIEGVKERLAERGEVYRVIEGPEGYQLAVAPGYSQWVRLLRKESRPLRLSGAAMETLAMVAYRQPITRAEMEAIRGVAVDSAVNKLIEHELIYVKGQADLPGRPRLYATTDKFLEFCGLASLEELPTSDVLSPKQISEWLSEQSKEPMTDKDMGLATEEQTEETEREEADEDAEEQRVDEQ